MVKVMLKKSNGIKSFLATALSIILISCENPAGPDPNGNPANIPKPAHTIIVVLENHALTQIMDKSVAPYINELADSGALFTQSYALTHPSQPNYLMLFSGSRQGVTNDAYPTNIPFTTPNLAGELLAYKYSFTGYSEDLPSVGYTGVKSGEYASKHSPWVYWQGTGANQIPPEVNQPLSNFPADFNKLPDLSFVIPNMDDDMHNGVFNPIIQTGDKWLKEHLDGYIKWAKDNNSLFILTFDEDNMLHDNRITTIMVGPMVKPGKYNEKITHYNVLRTLEDMFKLPHAGESAKSVPITDCWNPIK
jgi:hypothetical protein